MTAGGVGGEGKVGAPFSSVQDVLNVMHVPLAHSEFFFQAWYWVGLGSAGTDSEPSLMFLLFHSQQRARPWSWSVSITLILNLPLKSLPDARRRA